MNRSGIPSPSRSQGVSTPRKQAPRRSRSVCSAKSNASARLTNMIADTFHLSPMPNRRSVLTDNTDIDIPGRNSWWKKLGENSRDVMEVLENMDVAGFNNVAKEFDVEILSQEKKNYSLDLPESSDGESINSIVIPQRKLFTQKENQPQKKYKHIIDNRETLGKLQKSNFEQEKDINVGPKNLFNKASKPRNKPVFPAALLSISSKEVNKTKEMPAPEVKGQVRNLFGNRPGTKRKNVFADFIVSESEDEIPDIQPKVFGFQKNAQKGCERSASRGVGHSPTSSIDLELDDWKHLPSSTMVENILDEDTSPVKRARLSKLSVAKESETIATNNTANKTRQSNKSATSNNKSKASTSKLKGIKSDEVLSGSNMKEDLLDSKNNQSVNTSSNLRMTRNKSQSKRESSLKEEKHTRLHNKSQNKSQSQFGTPMEFDENNKNMKRGLNQQDVEKQVENMSTANSSGDDDEDFTLEYENDDEAANIENKSDENINLVDAVAATKIAEEESIDISKKIRSNVQSYKEVLADANVDKQNKSAVHEKEVNQALIEKDQMGNDEENVTNDIENTGEKQNVNHSTQRNDSTKSNDDNEVQNENDDELDEDAEQQQKSSQSNNAKEIINESRKAKAEIKRQNESNLSNKDTQNESILSDVESELDQEENNENFDETVIEAEEEKTENEQDESENEQESEEQVEEDASENEQEIEEHVQEDESENEQETEERAQEDESENEQEIEEHVQEIESENEQETEEQVQEDESENEQETVEQAQEDESENEQENEEHVQEEGSDTQIHQDESQNINFDNEGQNDNEANADETEEQQDEEMEVDEEENESEHEVSDDNLQNETNLSQNSEEDVQNESDQELGEEDSENEVIETSNHDTTIRNKMKDTTNVKSPEVILNVNSNQTTSFTAEGRNTSIRKTKSIIKYLSRKPSLAPGRESVGFSDGTRDSSAEGSGWDSHRTTRKTLRLTLGKDFTPRKSLRTLVLEKSAKRQTNINEVTDKVPQVNSTELPAFDSYHDAMEDNDTVEEPSDHEISARTRRTTLEKYMQKIKQENLEKRRKMEEDIRASLQVPTGDVFNPFKVPRKPDRRMKPVQNKPKPTRVKSTIISLDMLPSEVLEDMKYKPPKRFKPSNASWITKRLYKFLEDKLEPKYDYKARIRAERLVELLYSFTREIKRGHSEQAVDTLKNEMARLEIVKTHFEFYNFFHEFMPREIRIKVVPDIINKISLPSGGVFSDILQ